MAFQKLKCDTAYATGAIRSNLDMPHLIAKLKRVGLRVEMTSGQLRIQCGDEAWEFGDWEADGVGRIGWARMRILGDAGSLSRRLAQAGIRHKFEYSRPRDLETNDVRSVTRYDYRWDRPGLPPRSAVVPDITTFDEQL
jgi:hypothetical protein